MESRSELLEAMKRKPDLNTVYPAGYRFVQNIELSEDVQYR